MPKAYYVCKLSAYYTRKGEFILNRKEHAEKIYMQSKKGYLFDNKTKLEEVNNIVNPDIKSIDIINDRHKTLIKVWQKNTVDALMQKMDMNENALAGVLNFASYRHAGGGFIKGAFAQEEAFCHSTNLYYALEREQQWYDSHEKNLNQYLYGNEAILSENVTVIADSNFIPVKADKAYKTDVLTCAAPNRKAALTRYPDISRKADETMYSRIDYILNIFASKDYDFLILGAFGCGVFGNDAEYTAKCFKSLLENKYKGVFKEIIFAIPDNKNFRYFNECMKNFNCQ